MAWGCGVQGFRGLSWVGVPCKQDAEVGSRRASRLQFSLVARTWTIFEPRKMPHV